MLDLHISVIGTIEVAKNLEKIGPELTKKALATTVVGIERYIESQAAAHNKTGALVSSIYKKRLDAEGWVVGHNLQRAPHALFVVWGTKPHIIRPKTKLFLRWAGGGRFFFSKKVNHPGTKADNYIERAAREAPAMFAAHVETIMRTLL